MGAWGRRLGAQWCRLGAHGCRPIACGCRLEATQLMTTLLSDAITNARGSGDGGGNVAGFAASSLLMSALGIAPFTDNFYSGVGKDGGKSARLRTALAILSRGPVGFGDAVGTRCVAKFQRVRPNPHKRAGL